MKSALVFSACAGALAALSAAAQAAPTISVTPPDKSRFLTGQRFDLRVEGKPGGTSPITAATLAVDGTPVSFSSSDSANGVSGYNLRAYTNAAPGTHTLTATLTDATGTATATAKFQIINPAGGRRPAKNIIIMLGDGMGAAHRTAARIVMGGYQANQSTPLLNMDSFPGTGQIMTSSLNSIVTDSAPGMACYSSGSHANNGQEGVYPATFSTPFAQPRVEYLAEYLHRTQGKNLGIVSTADIEDATPAANVVHTGNRNLGQGICDQYLDEAGNSGLTVLMGGGRRWFLPAGQFGSSRSTSNDYEKLPADLTAAWNIPAGAIDPSRDLIADFKTAGFSYADSASGLSAAFAGGTPKKLLGLFGYGNMNVALDKIAHRRNPSTTDIVSDYHAPDQPMLDEMTTAALKTLSANSPSGFFLMVEGAHIDKQSHLMDADRAILETIEFDKACGVARDFAASAGDTVVIVLADHECSGFSIIGALNKNTGGTTGSLDALKALPSDTANTSFDLTNPPKRQGVVGTYDAAGFPQYTLLADGYPAQTDIDGKLLIGYGANGDRYEGWLTKPLPVIDGLLPSSFKTELAGKGYSGQPYARAESSLGFFLRGQVSGDQAVHTATDIPISAYSSSSRAFEQFIGVQQNTDVFFKLARAAFGGY